MSNRNIIDQIKDYNISRKASICLTNQSNVLSNESFKIKNNEYFLHYLTTGKCPFVAKNKAFMLSLINPLQTVTTTASLFK